MKTIWILSTLDRWDENYPWDVIGYVESKEEADKWVSEARTPHHRKSEEVKRLTPNFGVNSASRAAAKSGD